MIEVVATGLFVFFSKVGAVVGPKNFGSLQTRITYSLKSLLLLSDSLDAQLTISITHQKPDV